MHILFHHPCCISCPSHPSSIFCPPHLSVASSVLCTNIITPSRPVSQPIISSDVSLGLFARKWATIVSQFAIHNHYSIRRCITFSVDKDSSNNHKGERFKMRTTHAGRLHQNVDSHLVHCLQSNPWLIRATCDPLVYQIFLSPCFLFSSEFHSLSPSWLTWTQDAQRK
jgi:hypothetical protein